MRIGCATRFTPRSDEWSYSEGNINEVRHYQTPRAGGSGKDNEEAQRRVLELVSKWKPSGSTTIHQWVTRIDGGGGFAVGETDNPDDLIEVTSIFGPYVDYQIYPVVDFAGAIPAFQRGIEFRDWTS